MHPLIKQAILDTGASPLFWGGMGGIGGYVAGKSITEPYYNWREKNINPENLLRLEEIKDRRSSIPLIAAAVGALLLAAIASKKARENERDKINRMTAMGAHPEMGVGAGDVVPFRRGASFY